MFSGSLVMEMTFHLTRQQGLSIWNSKFIYSTLQTAPSHWQFVFCETLMILWFQGLLLLTLIWPNNISMWMYSNIMNNKIWLSQNFPSLSRNRFLKRELIRDYPSRITIYNAWFIEFMKGSSWIDQINIPEILRFFGVMHLRQGHVWWMPLRVF